MLKQQKIKINEVGKKHNMTSQDSLKAYYKICEFIAETISSTPRNDNGTYEPESFKTVGLPWIWKTISKQAKNYTD